MTTTRHIALYGKGGVGKTTLAANIGAALVEAGFKILLVGCDPKGDTSAFLNNGQPVPNLLGMLRQHANITPATTVYTGFKGISCVELGNPFQPGACAALEIGRAFQELRRIGLFESIDADVVIYDVTGDSSCSDHLTPIRQQGLDGMFVVTSADFMSLNATNAIFALSEKRDDIAPLRIRGLIPNNISSSFEESFIVDFARATRARTFGKIPRSLLIRQCELYGKTVIEAAPLSNQAYYYRKVANQIIDALQEKKGGVFPLPLTPEKLRSWARRWGDRIYALENGLVTDGEAI